MDKQSNFAGPTGPQNMPASLEGDGDTGLSNLAYDWVTILHNKAKGLRAYEDYIRDARQANAQECVSLLERIRDADRRQVDEIKQHVEKVLGHKAGQGQKASTQQRGGMGGSA